MLKSIALAGVLFFSTAVSVFAECGEEYSPMQRGILYSFVDVEITNSFIGKNQYFLKGKFTTSKLKPNEVKKPFYEEDGYTIVNRTCDKKIQIVEKTQNYIRVICPK